MGKGCRFARKNPSLSPVVECELGDGKDVGKGIGETEKLCCTRQHVNCSTLQRYTVTRTILS